MQSQRKKVCTAKEDLVHSATYSKIALGRVMTQVCYNILHILDTLQYYNIGSILASLKLCRVCVVALFPGHFHVFTVRNIEGVGVACMGMRLCMLLIRIKSIIQLKVTESKLAILNCNNTCTLVTLISHIALPIAQGLLPDCEFVSTTLLHPS